MYIPKLKGQKWMFSLQHLLIALRVQIKLLNYLVKLIRSILMPHGCAKTISLCEGKWQFSAGGNHLYYYLDVMY